MPVVVLQGLVVESRLDRDSCSRKCVNRLRNGSGGNGAHGAPREGPAGGGPPRGPERGFGAQPRLITKQILKFQEDRAVCLPALGGEEELVGLVIPVEVVAFDQVRLLIVVVVPDVEDRAGVDAVREEEVEVDRFVVGVVLGDVAEQEPVGELISGQRAENLDVEGDLIVVPRVGESVLWRFGFPTAVSRSDAG